MDVIRRQLLSVLFQLFDLALVAGSFTAANLVARYRDYPGSHIELLSMQVRISSCVLFALTLIAAHLIFDSLGLHDSKRLSTLPAEIGDLTKATTGSTLAVAGAAVMLHSSMINATFLITFFVLSTASAISSRVLLRTLLATARRRGRNCRNMLIVGTNRRALEFAAKIQAKPEMAYHIVGFADERWFFAEEFHDSNNKLVCDLESLPDYLRSNVVDEVILALPMRSLHRHASRIAKVCEEQGIILRLLCDLFDLKLTRRKAEEFEGDYVITHYTGTGMLSQGWSMMFKRVLDVVVSLVLLILLSPIFIVIAILIKLSSPGPAIFVQERLGQNKRRFRICKFRTMVVGAEQMLHELEALNEVSGPVFKLRNDPRVTLVGRVLRKLSIDELPQLFNVLKGDMSLVGPRPLDVRDYELMAQGCSDWQCYRFSVKPGITCLWQINGRNSIPFDQWMELDRQYIENWSLWLDFEILFRTIPVIFHGTGV